MKNTDSDQSRTPDIRMIESLSDIEALTADERSLLTRRLVAETRFQSIRKNVVWLTVQAAAIFASFFMLDEMTISPVSYITIGMLVVLVADLWALGTQLDQLLDYQKDLRLYKQELLRSHIWVTDRRMTHVIESMFSSQYRELLLNRPQHSTLIH